MLSAEAGGRIGFGRASARFFARYLSLAVLYIGYLMQPFTARRQALTRKKATTSLLSKTAAASRATRLLS